MKYLLIAILVIMSLYLLLILVFYVFQEKLIFHPEHLDQEYKFDFQADFQELNFRAKDGGNINALYFAVENPKGVVLYFHGNAGSLRSWGIEWNKFIPLGYNLLVSDYRSFGKSRGALDHRKLLDDAILLYEYLLKSFSSNEIILYGRSLGTGIATYLAGKYQPEKLILESPYYSFHDLAMHYFPFLPFRFILWFPLRTNKWMEKVTCPVSIIHGTADQVVPYESAKKLKKKFGNKIRFTTIEGGMHNNLHEFPSFRDWIRNNLCENEYIKDAKKE